MRSLFLSFLLLLSILPTPAGSSAEIPPIYQPLVDRLLKDGFDFQFLSSLFADSRAEHIPRLMTLTLNRGESYDLYSQFFSPESISLARTFLRQNLKSLKRAERQFEVEKEIIVAILLVESRFGENIGRWRVLPTLATLALIDAPENLQTQYEVLKEIDPELSYESIEKRARSRARWAYGELKCFLKIAQDEKFDPLEIRGSYTGAMGMAQFVPSSYTAFARNKGTLDQWVMDREAAIDSIGNYLQLHGWKRNLPVAKKKRILWAYNHSEPYVETIFKLARRIR